MATRITIPIDDVIEEIEYSIMTGQIRPKQRLVEAELMERFSLGRGVVRDILRVLEERGLVVRHSNRGAFVVDYTAKEVCDIYFLRTSLERIVCRLAVRNLHDEDIREMEALQAQLKSSPHTDKQLVKVHEAFHGIVHRAADNVFLEREMRRLILMSAPVRYLSYTHPSRRNVVLKQHDDMIRMLRDRDFEAFEHLALEHLVLSMKEYMIVFHPAEAEEMFSYYERINAVAAG